MFHRNDDPTFTTSPLGLTNKPQELLVPGELLSNLTPFSQWQENALLWLLLL